MELCVAGYGYWHCCCCCCFFYAVCFVRQIIFYFFRISFQHLFENQFVCKWVSLSVCVVDAWCWYCGLCYLRKKKKIIISKPVPHSDSHLNGDPMGMKDSQSNICITDLMTLFHSMFFSLFDSYLKSHFQLKL